MDRTRQMLEQLEKDPRVIPEALDLIDRLVFQTMSYLLGNLFSANIARMIRFETYLYENVQDALDELKGKKE